MPKQFIRTNQRGSNDTSELDSDQRPFGEDPYAPLPEPPDPNAGKIKPDIDPNDAGDEGSALRVRKSSSRQ